MKVLVSGEEDQEIQSQNQEQVIANWKRLHAPQLGNRAFLAFTYGNLVYRKEEDFSQYSYEK